MSDFDWDNKEDLDLEEGIIVRSVLPQHEVKRGGMKAEPEESKHERLIHNI